MNAHDSIMQGLNEVLAFAQGQHVGANVHHVEALSRCRRNQSANRAVSRRIRTEHWRSQGHIAELGAWAAPSHWPSPGAAGHDR